MCVCVYNCYATLTHRAGLLERMPAMSTKTSTTGESSLLQNGEPTSTAPAESTTTQLPLQVRAFGTGSSLKCTLAGGVDAIDNSVC